MEEAKTKKISAETLETFITELFEKANMSKKDAVFHAKALVKSNLWGVDSHGVIRVPAYFNRMLNGGINTKPDIKVVRGEGNMEVIDGDGAAGFIVAREAMKRAIEKARVGGIAAVGAVNSNHFGAGGLYARMAVEEGMVGIAMTNVKPLIVGPGAKKPVVGNNPIAFGIPTYGDFPFILDMSLSKVAGGKLTLAIKKKEKIPMDWATDKEGKPTDDPQKAFDGYLMPMGDYKGLGLAYVVDILSGVISGGVFSHQMKSMYANPEEPSLTGHFMIVLDISKIIPKEEMKKRMKEYYDTLKATPMLEEGTEMFLPGEIEYRKEQERLRDGVPVPETTIEELKELAEKYNVNKPLTVLE
ncbi:Ldh family oxidoreductase [Eubacterium callanderi]|uniref:Ldh family oxidoreductase n=1 Tax=Eubacterium callanderi TaxID=53442 RepID=UPI001C0FA1A6|nr:Ldh family oxidoreductase [Eubacterium callanderi]MBU5305829.1 Ldh family oxidoreductase [Eubacterium callanderi]